MFSKKLWNFVSLAALVMLPLAGCSGGGSSPAKATEKGTEITVAGKVAGSPTAKSVGKTAIAANTVEVYNAQDGAALGNATVAADGSFTGLTFTLPSTKTVLVFKATVTQGTFLSIVPVDLSTPPAAGTITGSNPISIVISEQSTAVAQLVSQFLGLTGDLGDTGQTLASVSKTYVDAAQLVVNNGGQQLAYGGSGLALTGKFTSADLLPAVNVATLTTDQLKALANSLKVTVTQVAIPGNSPIVSFQVTTAAGKGVIGLKNAFDRFAIATLVPGTSGAPDEWLNYMTRTSGAALGWPDAERRTTAGYATRMIDNGDGSYSYIFAKDIKNVAGVPYVNSQTHRVGFVINGTPLGAAAAMVRSLPPVHDFVPAGGTPDVSRDIASVAGCNECHTDLSSLIGHTASRGDVRFCVMCHTKQSGAAFADTVSTGGAFDPATAIQKADGELLGYFPVMIHKIHMGNKLSKTGYNFFNIKFNTLAYPKGNSVANCRQCHATGKAPQGDNWQTRPTRMACGSCHDNINFATGANSKVGGVAHAAQADDSFCVSCHGVSGPYPVANYHSLPATADVAKRTMSATITGVTVDSTTGKVTANFTVSDGGVAVTDKTLFSAPTFVLAKLVKDANGVLNWVGYTNQFNTKNAALGLVKQTKGENDGTLVANPDGSFSYTFKLKTATPEGDIRNVDHAHNVAKSSATVNVGPYDINSTGAYVTSTPADRLLYGATVELPYPVLYEPTKTHRVAMTFKKIAGNVDANNAWFDFVPAGTAVTDTRDIVKMKNCAGCHANSKLHAAYEIEVCVTCHNPTTKDPGTGETVALETIVHKLHMGKNLPSVLAGGTYVVNVAHDYSAITFPGLIKNCQMCHLEGTGAPKNAANWRTNPTAASCITCHDGATSVTHATQNANTCITCHGSSNYAAAEKVHNK